MMKKIFKYVSVILSILIIAGLFASCASNSSSDAEEETTASAEVLSLAKESEVTVNSDGAASITLNGESVSIDGKGATADGGTVVIGSGGTYTVTGTLSDGRIIIDADGGEVTVILDNASISCSYSSAIFVYNAKSVTLYLAEDSTNSLADGSTYTYTDSYSSEADEEPNACIYSKDDLIIAGSGNLRVSGNFNNGIVSKDTLKIESVTLGVTAKNHGINGKDNLTVKKAALTISAGGDALRSTNDTDTSLGYIILLSSKLKLTAGEDGVQAETYVHATSSTVSIKSGGGSSVTPSDSVSAKGIKAGTDITVDGGKLTIDASDDAIHANNCVSIQTGEISITTGDDGVHADYKLTIDGGTLSISGHEGLEATLVTINDGTITIDASDDGINAAQKVKTTTATVEINGGTITINMGQGDTDAIDSNGNLYINGGTLNITAQSAFDYDGTGKLNGGTVYVNGEQVTELTNQFAGGMGMGGGPVGRW